MSVAPMLDWTDRHCRYFHRLLTRHTLLYTEMVTTGAILHGNQPRHLDFNPEEHPVALQLGGSNPTELAACARLAEQAGYDEVNLNVGCPSDRVQNNMIGACLMAHPALVAECVKAMREAVSIPVTVKHRIGIDGRDSYAELCDFVGQVRDAGCRSFTVHARIAILSGLSPKENREIPPLRYELGYQLKKDFPNLVIAINGGITTNAQMAEHLQHVDGVMLGREAYYRPWLMTTWDAEFYNDPHDTPSREAVEEAMVAYMERAYAEDGCPWYAIARHMLGLYHGERGARLWRQVWSNHKLKPLPPREVLAIAREALTRGAERPVDAH